jgi:hypothetical protein
MRRDNGLGMQDERLGLRARDSGLRIRDVGFEVCVCANINARQDVSRFGLRVQCLGVRVLGFWLLASDSW